MHLQATMATARLPSAQRSATGLITDTKSRQKDVILQCLTRLNDKSTLRVSAEELSAIIRSLDLDGLGCMVQSICSTGTWEPKPFAKKECLRALGQLPCSTCPAAEVAIQQPYLGKALGHLKRNLQDSDSLVRDAACEALAAYAWAIAEATGAPLPGTSSSASPLIRVLFECLAEQKKEAQLGASQALLLIAPCIGPLDGDLIKLILRLLRSSTFQGTTALLLAVASFDPESSRPAGLLARGQSAFLPYLKHLIGQPAPRRTSATGPDATAGTKEGGLLGCLCSSDWAVRRAAADAIRAAVLVLGPRMEPHGCWQLGDAGSLTHKCLAELEERRFDKVKEAREAIKEAMVIIQHLHAFVSSIGPVGDWQAWVKAHIPSAGLMSPARADICSTSSPEQSGHECSGDRQATVAALRSSPISRNFQMAAAQADMVADPYSPKAAVQETTAARLQQDNDSNLLIATNGSLGGPEDASGVRQSAAGSATEADAQPDADETSAGVMMDISEGKHNMLQCSGRQRSDVSPDGTTAVGRTSSSAFRRSNSISSSRPLTGESQQLLKRQSSSGRGAIVAHNTQPTAAGVELQPRGRSRSSNDGLQRPGSRNASRSDHGDNQTWSGPNAVEWQKLQQQLLDHQQQLAATQHLLMASQQQQQSLTATVQQMQVHYDGVITALQEQVRDLQQQLQQQEPCADVHIYSGGNGQIPPSQAGPGSPSQLGSRRSSSAIGKSDPGAVAATSHEAPSTATATHGHKSSWRTSEASTADRLFRSADWTTPTSSMPRRPSGSVLNSMSISRRSMNGANTPTSAGLFEPQDAPVQTPSRYDAAFTEALHGDKGEVHLLRLLQKTGIAWHMLSPNTSQDLLKFFIKEVKEGVMLHRVVSWLWRLADDDAARPDIPVRMQQELLEALRNCPAADETKAQEKVPLLMQTLELCWQQSSRDDEFP